MNNFANEMPYMENSLPLLTEIPFLLLPILGKESCPEPLCGMCAGHEPLWHSRSDEDGVIDTTWSPAVDAPV